MGTATPFRRRPGARSRQTAARPARRGAGSPARPGVPLHRAPPHARGLSSATGRPPAATRGADGPAPRLTASARPARSVRGGGREGSFDGGAARRLSASSPFLPSFPPSLPSPRRRRRPPRQPPGAARARGALPGARRQPYLCAPLPMAAHLPARAAQSAGGSSLCPAPLVKESSAARESYLCAPGPAALRAEPSFAEPRRRPSPAAPHMRGGGGSTCPTSAAGCGAGRGGEGKQNYQ